MLCVFCPPELTQSVRESFRVPCFAIAIVVGVGQLVVVNAQIVGAWHKYTFVLDHFSFPIFTPPSFPFLLSFTFPFLFSAWSLSPLLSFPSLSLPSLPSLSSPQNLNSKDVDPEVLFTKQEIIGKGSFGEVFKGYVNHPNDVMYITSL